MITKNVSTLKIHKLTQAQYDRELEAGTIDENALYLTPDEMTDLSKYATVEQLEEKADVDHTHDDLYYTEIEVDGLLSSKSDTSHTHDNLYDAKGSAETALDTAKSYTDTKTSGLASTSSVDTKISIHNTSTSAHNDIRDLITELTTRLNTLADSDDTTLDQMSEIVTYIKSNKSLIDSITTSKVNVSDIINNLTTNVSNKPLSAAQGVAIKGLIDALQGQLDANESRADRFFPDSAMHNLVTDCLQINTAEDWTSNSGNRDSVIATEDVSTIVNSPISSGAFYAYREIRQVECAGRNPKTIVTLKEAYPIGGREWSRTYNPDTGHWDEQWNCHDGACSHRDLGKSITDIVTNGTVYVCTPDRSKTMPICASEFTTGDGHNLTEKVSNSDIFKGVFNSGNIDELMTYGVYWVKLDQNSTTITGTIPPYVNTQFGYFEVLKAYKEGTDCMQRFTEYFGGVVHTRVYVNGGWLDWETYNLNDYLPLSGGTLSGKLMISAGGLSINGNSNYLNLNDDSGTSRIQLWVDNEGGNLKICSPDSYASNWEIDAFNGNLRIRDTVGGNTYVFKSVANGGTGGTFAAAAFKSCQDSSSAGTLSSSGTNLCTERDVYYGLPTINGSHSYNSNTNIYAPTSVGTKGQVLVSNGSGAPSWQAMSNQIKILNGTVSISVSSDWASNSANVTFPSAFTVAPLVQASTTDGNGSVNIKSITKTGCVISYYAAADPGTKTIRWTAMGY